MDLLSGLNAAQREAVTHRGGPLMVLAGPGTGKTRLIVHRVAHMILEEGIAPEQIVALTFTVKACEQMRQRLAEVLASAAPSEAGKANLVNVHTYHGAGHRLVKRFADRLGLGRSGGDLELIDSAQRRRMLRRLIGEDGHMRAMLGQGVDAAAERAADTIDALSDYAVDPKGALALAKKWGERLKANKEELDAATLAMERAELTVFEQTARLFEACQREQRKRGWLTFGDLITWPLALLRNDQLARDLVRGQWRHGVVDEFQDVNQATIALLEELFPPKAQPDLCVVGDDDQAIYAFRGADDRAFARFTQRWPGHATVKLEENYRSEAAVIAVANATIGRAENRYDPTKIVRRPDARAKDKPVKGAAAVVVLTERNADSGEPIVAMLMREREQSKGGLKWGSVAVVARSHLELDRVSMALEAEGIPADRVGGRGNAAVDDPGVKDLLAWCRVLVHPLDFEHARRLLLRPPVSMTGQRVLDLLQKFKAVRSRAEVPGPTGGAEAADEFIPWAAAQCTDDAGVQNLAKVYAEFRARLAGSLASDLLYDLSLRVDVVHSDLLPARERGRRLAAVVSLLRFAFARQKRLDQPGDLDAFLSYWDDLDRREQEGLAESARVDADDEAALEAGGGEDRGVVLITAHAAKGLEFDTVFVPKVSAGLGYPSSRASEPRLPLAVLKELGAEGDEQTRRQAEERRLFYVACTRAERRLVMLGSVPKSKSTATNFLLELTACQPKLELLEHTDLETVVGSMRPAEESSVARELLETKVRKDRDAKRDELAARARAQAAAALEKAFRAAVTSTDLAAAEAALADAAKTLAIVAEAHATGGSPAWAKKDKGLAERAGAIAQALKPDKEAPALFDTAGLTVPPVRGPLTLSYTQINDFERCPGCWYVKTQMRLERTPSSEISTGVVVHEALCTFFGRWAEADALGNPLPTLDELLVLGRARFIEAFEGGVLDKAELERCEEMLRTAFKLHSRGGEGVHIIEHPELEVRVPLVMPSGSHTLYACIDRLERFGDDGGGGGGVRIVDYKTGKEWKKLLEPPADDLQMGIYAIAVDHFFGGGAEVPARTPGVAEYWLLATGGVGAIGLDKLNMKKVRDRIDKAAAGMLSGPYITGERCSEGLCRLLTPGVVVDP